MILAVISQIPYGRVATYGQIAKLAGLAKHARLVGKVLSQLDEGTDLPWYRVINAQGKLSLNKLDAKGQNTQQLRLSQEGIFVNQGKVNLKQYQWDGWS
ncbi:MGMT family protein [Acinetobacter bohemicus]|uniref:MGMT family protein n=1 Tax=Acinetobacter lwoffii TaxID=28090 RepID=A0A9D2ZZY7_ACILW|nr:MGMT family protein [Acinetobacter sp. S4397-1]HJF28427.1 MGMT family protein [Acinetobacter lwoffii]